MEATAYPFTMRRALAADRTAITALCKAISDHDWVPGSFDGFLGEQPPNGLYLAESEGRLVGCYHLGQTAPGEAYFSAMRIDPAAQGRGFGSQFCRAQVAQARESGVRRIFLLSQADNLPAHRTVERNGFENLGPWVIFEGVEGLPDLPAPRRARFCTEADLPALRRELDAGRRIPLDELVSTRSNPWVIRTQQPFDLEPAAAAVVMGGYGPEGLMLLAHLEGSLCIRLLQGTAEAAAELVGLAVATLQSRGLDALQISLPAPAEALLAPLGLDPAAAFRAYVFCHFAP